jgi:hypothetical protein
MEKINYTKRPKKMVIKKIRVKKIEQKIRG